MGKSSLKNRKGSSSDAGASSSSNSSSSSSSSSSSGMDAGDEQNSATNTLLQQTQRSVNELYRKVLDPVVDSFNFTASPTKAQLLARPMIVLLGNHSSGKSTFINYLLGVHELQVTGQAPMDDGFTLLTYGSNRDEQDGHALVSNTHLPYVGLANLGTNFVEHLRMRFVNKRLLQAVTLVDSPGMIDAVGEKGRGYDFANAVHWFATRADYVLFFFDGEKPGVVGETLDVFTKLSGMDHKLLILMNKVDTFRNIADFVRTYGTLCWNLSKVLPYKDMPFIYTTYVETSKARISNSTPVSSRLEVQLESDEEEEHDDTSRFQVDKKAAKKKKKHGDHAPALSQADEEILNDPETPTVPNRSWSLDEFAKARKMVISKIESAPSRHADNMITALKNNTMQLLMHARVITAARSTLWWAQMRSYFMLLLFTSLACILSFVTLRDTSSTTNVYQQLLQQNVLLGGVSVLIVALLVALVWIPRTVRAHQDRLVDSLDSVFERVYNHELTRGSQAEYYRSMWLAVLPVCEQAIDHHGLLSLPSLRKADEDALKKVIDEDIIQLFDVVHKALKRK